MAYTSRKLTSYGNSTGLSSPVSEPLGYVSLYSYVHDIFVFAISFLTNSATSRYPDVNHFEIW